MRTPSGAAPRYSARLPRTPTRGGADPSVAGAGYREIITRGCSASGAEPVRATAGGATAILGLTSSHD